MKKRSGWVLVVMMLIVAALWGCGSADPNGGPLQKPADSEETAKPTPKSSAQTKNDGGASGSGSGPATTDGGSGPSVPADQLVLSSITPVTATAGSPATPLTVNGSGFKPTTRVLFGGQSLSPSQSNATSLTVTIPETLLANAGSIDVRLVEGSTTAGPATFTVSNAQMTLTAITPSTASVGDPAVSIRLSGSGFVPSARATFNGVTLTTTYTSPMELSAVIPASSLATAGTYSVAVTAGAATTAPQTFTVKASRPVFASFSPGAAPAGSIGGWITIVGSGFNATSGVLVDGVRTDVIVDSTTRMRAWISSFDLAFPGFLAIRVFNGPLYADGVGYFEVY